MIWGPRSENRVRVRFRSLCRLRRRLLQSVAAAGILAGVLCGLVSAPPARAYTTEGCYWPRVERGQAIPWIDYATGAAKWAYFAAKDSWNATPTKIYISGSGNYITGNNGNFGNTGWDGITYLHCYSNGVFIAPINTLVNNYYGDGGARLQSVTVHEFGHALGLGHSYCGTLMYYATGGCRPDTPQADDINGVRHIYP